MSLIKNYVLSIQQMNYDPFNLDKLSPEEWDILLTKAMKKDSKLYGALIWKRCKLKGEKYFEERAT